MAFTAGSTVANAPSITAAQAGEVLCAVGVWTVTTAPTLNQVVPAVKLPRDAVITDVKLVSTDMDTSGSPTFAVHVGDAGDNDRLLAGSTVAQTGAVAASSLATAIGYRYPAETVVNITVSAAPTTFAAGSMTLLVSYVFDPV